MLHIGLCSTKVEYWDRAEYFVLCFAYRKPLHMRLVAEDFSAVIFNRKVCVSDSLVLRL